MVSMGRGVFFTFATISMVSYCGAWWFLWPCHRFLGEGRELREGNPNPRNSLMRGEQPCSHHDGGDTSGSVDRLHIVETTSEGATPIVRPDSGSMLEVKSHMIGEESFESPWSAAMTKKALQEGSKPSYFKAATKCTGIDFLSHHDGFIPAWHKRERVVALKAVQADKTVTSKTCPKSADVLEQLKSDAEAQAGSGGELTAPAGELKSYGKANNIDIKNAGAVVHIAETDNEYRTLLGKNAQPMTAEYLAKHWVPVVNSLIEGMNKNGCDHANCATQVHFWLMEEQLKEIKNNL